MGTLSHACLCVVVHVIVAYYGHLILSYLIHRTIARFPSTCSTIWLHTDTCPYVNTVHNRCVCVFACACVPTLTWNDFHFADVVKSFITVEVVPHSVLIIHSGTPFCWFVCRWFIGLPVLVAGSWWAIHPGPSFSISRQLTCCTDGTVMPQSYPPVCCISVCRSEILATNKRVHRYCLYSCSVLYIHCTCTRFTCIRTYRRIHSCMHVRTHVRTQFSSVIEASCIR